MKDTEKHVKSKKIKKSTGSSKIGLSGTSYKYFNHFPRILFLSPWKK